MPVPKNAIKADLALTKNVPRFTETLKVVLAELEVESVIVAEKMISVSQEVHKEAEVLLPDIKTVTHESFKSIYHNDKDVAFIRTGEFTKYANIILISGTTF